MLWYTKSAFTSKVRGFYHPYKLICGEKMSSYAFITEEWCVIK